MLVIVDLVYAIERMICGYQESDTWSELSAQMQGHVEMLWEEDSVLIIK